MSILTPSSSSSYGPSCYISQEFLRVKKKLQRNAYVEVPVVKPLYSYSETRTKFCLIFSRCPEVFSFLPPCMLCASCVIIGVVSVFVMFQSGPLTSLIGTGLQACWFVQYRLVRWRKGRFSDFKNLILINHE